MPTRSARPLRRADVSHEVGDIRAERVCDAGERLERRVRVASLDAPEVRQVQPGLYREVFCGHTGAAAERANTCAGEGGGSSVESLVHDPMFARSASPRLR